MRTRVPANVFDQRVPSRFRSWWLHFEDPVLVLTEFIGWLEERLPEPAGDAPEPPAVERDRGRAADERATLVRGLMELGDLVPSSALRHQITDLLAAVGVTAIDSVGERFDPSRHRAVDRVATVDPGADGRIAETERLGYSDRGRIARLPEVLVYRRETNGDAA
jgi:hypothetical protein